MVFAHADIHTRIIFRAALANNNIARNNSLSAGLFYTKATASTIATII